jgi:hypothetical protein
MIEEMNLVHQAHSRGLMIKYDTLKKHHALLLKLGNAT